MSFTKYSQEEINFLKLNYVKLGRRKCAEILNRTKSSIKSKCQRLKISNTEKETYIKLCSRKKKPGEYTVKESFFINNINEIPAYLLGFLWADGNLYRKQEKINPIFRITLGISIVDSPYIAQLLNQSGKWSIVQTKPKIGKQITYFTCNNPYLGEFLETNDFLIKSSTSPDKILELIPIEFKKYFFLGYLDGDGCIYASLKNHNYSITFTSSYFQNWKFLEDLCKQITCNYTIKRIIRKNCNSKYSDFKINGSKNCILFGNFLYNGNKEIGFLRKREKFLIIINKIKNLINNNCPQWEKHKKEFKNILDKY